MPRYRVVSKRVANAIIHVNSYYIILRLIERELANLELSFEERIQIGLAHIKFQRLFYNEWSNRSSTVPNDHWVS